jgi:hypothetical protein
LLQSDGETAHPSEQIFRIDRVEFLLLAGGQRRGAGKKIKAKVIKLAIFRPF